METKPSVSAIVVSRNTRDRLRTCLAALGESCPNVHISVALIENASTDGSLEMAREEFPGIGILSHGENLGYARAVNLGFRELEGPLYLVLNGDCRIPAASVGILAAVHGRLDRPGVLGPRQVDDHGNLCLTWGRSPTPWREWKRKRLQRRLRTHPEAGDTMDSTGRPRSVHWVSGSCWLVHREPIEAAGPLDETFFLYFEDIDWCLRLARLGYTNYYVPEVSAVHPGGKSAELEPESAEIAYRRSQIHFVSKHRPRIERALVHAWLTAKYSWTSLLGSNQRRSEARRIRRAIGWKQGAHDHDPGSKP